MHDDLAHDDAESSSSDGHRDWRTRRAELADAYAIANDFLDRWEDSFTRSHRDALSQVAALTAVRRWRTLRDKGRFPAFVRTIARRERAHAVRAEVRFRAHSIDADSAIAEQLCHPAPEQTSYSVGGTWVEQAELMRLMPKAMGALSRLNQRLLMSYYEGFSCQELGERFDLTEESVKLRIHRSRCRLKGVFESRVITETGELRDWPFQVPALDHKKRRTEL